MADVPVPLVNTPMDDFSSDSEATALTAGDVGVISAGSDTDNLLVMVTNTTAQRDVTVVAGVGPRSARGDLVVEFDANETRFLAVESARFAQADGTVRVVMEGAGSIRAVRLPAGA